MLLSNNQVTLLYILNIYEIVSVLSQLGQLILNYVDNYPKMYHLLKKLAFTEVHMLLSNSQVTLLYIFNMCKIVLVSSQLGHLTLDLVDNYLKKSHLLKKLAFTEVFMKSKFSQRPCMMCVMLSLLHEMNCLENVCLSLSSFLCIKASFILLQLQLCY